MCWMVSSSTLSTFPQYCVRRRRRRRGGGHRGGPADAIDPAVLGPHPRFRLPRQHADAGVVRLQNGPGSGKFGYAAGVERPSERVGLVQPAAGLLLRGYRGVCLNKIRALPCGRRWHRRHPVVGAAPRREMRLAFRQDAGRRFGLGGFARWSSRGCGVAGVAVEARARHAAVMSSRDRTRDGPLCRGLRSRRRWTELSRAGSMFRCAARWRRE